MTAPLPVTTNLALQDVFNVDRVGSAYYFDSSGDFVESVILNDVPYTQIFEPIPGDGLQSGWGLTQSTLVDFEDVQYTDEDGLRQARLYRIADNTTFNNHIIRESNFAIANPTFCASMICKDFDRRYVALWMGESGNINGVNVVSVFDLQTGSSTPVQSASVAVTINSQGMVALGNGLYRVFMNVTMTGVTNIDFRMGLHDGVTAFGAGSNIPDYVGDVSSAFFGCPMVTPGGALVPFVHSLAGPTRSGVKPRIDFDPSTGEVKGALFERQATNLATFSEDLTNIVYTNKANIVVAAGVSFATNIDLSSVLETATSGLHRLIRNFSAIVSAGDSASVSMIVQANGRDKMGLHLASLSDFANRVVANVDLAAGIATTSEFGTATGYTSITDLGSGVFRVTCTCSVPGETDFSMQPRLRNAAEDENYAGDASLGMYWGAVQVETGAPTSYVPAPGGFTSTRPAEEVGILDNHMSPWYRAAASTTVLEYIRGPGAAGIGIDITLGGANFNRTTLRVLGSSDGQLRAETSNGYSALSQGSLAAQVPHRVAYRISNTDCAISVDGELPTIDTEGAIAGRGTEVILGQAFNGASPVDSWWIREYKVLHELLDDGALQAESGDFA